jgi:hypothetical protein
MNVTFHTLTALGGAAVLASKKKDPERNAWVVSSDMPLLGLGFVAGVLTHGLLDYAPHSYPIESRLDMALSLSLFLVALFFSRIRHWVLAAACFFGSVFPDLADLGPAILNKQLGLSLFVVKIFPWHWREYSGSIYDGSRDAESLLYHVLVLSVGLYLLWTYRNSYRRKGSHNLFRVAP